MSAKGLSTKFNVTRKGNFVAKGGSKLIHTFFTVPATLISKGIITFRLIYMKIIWSCTFNEWSGSFLGRWEWVNDSSDIELCWWSLNSCLAERQKIKSNNSFELIFKKKTKNFGNSITAGINSNQGYDRPALWIHYCWILSRRVVHWWELAFKPALKVMTGVSILGGGNFDPPLPFWRQRCSWVKTLKMLVSPWVGTS